jgi:antitoxin component of RelBE/YafQ-DinJ toxin-antitoxin module
MTMITRIILSLGLCLSLLAFKAANDVLTEVGTTISEVRQITIKQIYAREYTMPWVNTRVRNACKNLPAGVREATMMSLGKLVRDYVQSAEFEKDYNAYVDANARNYGPAPEDAAAMAERKRRENYELSHLKDALSLDGAAMYCTAMSNMARTMLDMVKDNPDIPLGKMTKADYEHMEVESKRLRALFDKDREAFKKEYVVFKVDNELKSQRTSQQNDAEQ